ncbi:MAG: hypothetical protein PUC47_06505 [Oscillospiraceae bacterium]|nr:hypothetical protein [Oscillospiraceae bacterium]
MEYGEKFKKSVFGGFDRQDVLRCLEEMQQQSHAEIEKLREESASLQQQRDMLQRTVSEQTDQLREQAAALAAAEEQITVLTEARKQAESRCEALQRELSAQKALNTELLMKKNVLEENCRRLTAQNEELTAKNQELAGQIDERAALALGELMVEAKVNANRIEERARQRAADSDAVVTARCEGVDMRLTELQSRLERAAESFQQMCAAAVQNIRQISSEVDRCREDVRETIPVSAPASDPAEEASAAEAGETVQTASAEERAAAAEPAPAAGGAPAAPAAEASLSAGQDKPCFQA